MADLRSLRRPPPLRDGHAVHIVAPSGPVDAKRFERGRARLAHALGRAGHQLQWHAAEHLFAREGYFAGPDGDRVADLRAAFEDPSGGVIWAARGGYGLTRILDKLDPKLFARHPKTIVGFSDITALLAWAQSTADMAALHAPVVTQLSSLHPHDLDATLEWLNGEVPAPLEATEDVSVVHGGTVEGPMFAANLEVLRSLIGTPYFPDLDKRVLALEEVGEQPYRIDRALTQLIRSGSLRGVAGIVVGQLLGCEDPRARDESGRPTAREVFTERLGHLGVPLFTGAPFGHAPARNFPLPIGARVRLDADNATLIFLEPLCVAA